jgi:hypothetical protein
MRAVVHQPLGLDLRLPEFRGHMDGHFLEAQLLRGQQPRVAGDDDVLRVHHNGLPPAELADGRGYFVHGGSGNLAGVPGVRNDLLNGPKRDFHANLQA